MRASAGSAGPAFEVLPRRFPCTNRPERSPASGVGLSVIGKSVRRSSHPRSHTPLLIPRAREARSGTPIELQPLEAPLIAGWRVLFASPEYAASATGLPARNSATIKLTRYPSGGSGSFGKSGTKARSHQACRAAGRVTRVIRLPISARKSDGFCWHGYPSGHRISHSSRYP